MPPATAIATFELVLTGDAAEQAIFSASSGAAGSTARARFSTSFRYALARHLHISEYRVLITHVLAGSLVAGVKIIDTPDSTAALEPPAKDCEMTLTSQLMTDGTAVAVQLDGSFTAVKLIALYPPSPPVPLPAAPPIMPLQDQVASLMPAIAGAAGGGGALLVAALLVVMFMLFWRRGYFGSKRAVSIVRTLPLHAQRGELATLSPNTRDRARSSSWSRRTSDMRARAHSKLDAMSGIAQIVASAAAKAKGQRDIELARKAAHLKGGLVYPTPAAPPSDSPPSSMISPLQSNPARDSVLVEPHFLLVTSTAEPALEASATPTTPAQAMAVGEGAGNMAPPSPLKRAGSMFVEKIGWMSSKSAKKLGKEGFKGSQAEAMATALMGPTGSAKDGSMHSNKLASTAI